MSTLGRALRFFSFFRSFTEWGWVLGGWRTATENPKTAVTPTALPERALLHYNWRSFSWGVLPVFAPFRRRCLSLSCGMKYIKSERKYTTSDILDKIRVKFMVYDGF